MKTSIINRLFCLICGVGETSWEAMEADDQMMHLINPGISEAWPDKNIFALIIKESLPSNLAH